MLFLCFVLKLHILKWEIFKAHTVKNVSDKSLLKTSSGLAYMKVKPWAVFCPGYVGGLISNHIVLML